MIPEQGWQCPVCKRIYSPRQEMCLYCGPNEKNKTVNVGEWISTNPCIIDTTKGPTNIKETNGASTSSLYPTTGSINAMEIPIPDAIPTVTLYCSGYDTKNKICNGVKEPFQSDCAGDLKKCTEY